MADSSLIPDDITVTGEEGPSIFGPNNDTVPTEATRREQEAATQRRASVGTTTGAGLADANEEAGAAYHLDSRPPRRRSPDPGDTRGTPKHTAEPPPRQAIIPVQHNVGERGRWTSPPW